MSRQGFYPGLGIIVSLSALLLQGCSSSGGLTPEQIQAGRYALAHDHAPQAADHQARTIADAVPQPPDGPLKYRPYRLYGLAYTPLKSATGYRQEGIASWYGVRFHGYKTANGELYDIYSMTAAHKTLPLPSYARVTHLKTGRSIVVRINDRGPFRANRLIDLSWAAARKLGIDRQGIARVRVEGIDTSPEGLAAFRQSLARTNRRHDTDTRVAWLQVAALKDKQKAQSLKEHLENQLDNPVRLVPGQDPGLLKVRVGPFFNKQSLEKARRLVNGCCQLDGYTVYE